MLGWVFDKLKWLLIVAAVGGPGLAFYCWQDGQRRQEVMANGVETTAAIDGATRTKRRRGGTSYKLALSWTDAQGAARKAEDVPISQGYADRLIQGDKIVADTVRIRYIADGGESENLVVSEDESWQERTDQDMIYIGAVAGVVGAIGSALIFLLGRRRQGEATTA